MNDSGIDADRQVYRITGTDRIDFLQGLVTNDLARLGDGAVYAALLSPQGKYLADFFLIADGEAVLLDAHRSVAADLFKRLSMYKLRADVQIAEAEVSVTRGTGTPPDGALPDPRDPALGWRSYGAGGAGAGPAPDPTALRVARLVPETGVELIPNDTYILEAGFERLHGVDFRKGCYVGQEVTARMKHKTELRKGLARVAVSGTAPVGTEILTVDGKPAGTLYSQADGAGIAYLRYDRAGGDMTAGEARVTRLPD